MSTKITAKDNFEKISLEEATQVSGQLSQELNDFCERIVVAGSIRRKKSLVGDIDVVVIPKNNIDFLTKIQDIIAVEYGGPKKVFGIYKNRPINIFITTHESIGACTYQCTGPAEYNIRKRCLVKGKGFKLNEYGLFERDTNVKVAGETEESIFKIMGWTYREPENRV